ncbi:P1 family peptidase [Gordonia sp. DT30]|uniref:P1 family peptidase n=1 Tax=Gordonia sp. DT30 TaxID=3416546 RepID=UPI003CE88D04
MTVPTPEQAVRGNRITDVGGITVGHHHRVDPDVTVGGGGGGGGGGRDEPAGTGWASGTTVVRIDGPHPCAAVDVRGGGPGTRETDLLDPTNTVTTAHAIVLTGGSAYGLAAADGVMAELESQGVGLAMDAQGHVVPIVPAAVIFDLPVGAWHNRPSAEFGAAALRAAATDFALGSVGGGAGARAGSLKGGVGTASRRIEDGPAAGVVVGAVIVANPVGAVIDPDTGLPWFAGEHDLARLGLQTPNPAELADLREIARKATVLNTTIGVVATDAGFAPSSLRRVAMSAHDGLALAIRPVHSPLDGDTIFAVSTGSRMVEPTPQIPAGMYPDTAVLAQVCAVATEVTRDAVVSAVIAAHPIAGIPAYRHVMPSALR